MSNSLGLPLKASHDQEWMKNIPVFFGVKLTYGFLLQKRWRNKRMLSEKHDNIYSPLFFKWKVIRNYNDSLLQWILNIWLIRDCLVTSAVNSFTSFFSGFVIFTYLGYMAKSQGKDIENVADQGGRGLALFNNFRCDEFFLGWKSEILHPLRKKS